MPKRILIMPAGHYQAPAIERARGLGFEVVAADGDAHAPGLALADVALAVNPTHVDALLAAVGGLDLDAVIAVASDPCVVPCARIAKALGLSSIAEDTARLCRNKLLSLNRLAQAKREYCPDFLEIKDRGGASQAASKFGYPFVLKPSESNGSKGVRIVETPADLDGAFAYAKGFSGGLPLVAVEYLEGPEVSVETMTQEGKTVVVALTDKIVGPPPFCVELGHTVPSGLAPEERHALEKAACAVVEAMEIEFGPAHTELKLTGKGPRLIEIGARLGGGCIASHLVPLATGVDLVKAQIVLSAGDTPDLESSTVRAAAVRFIEPKPGLVKRVQGAERARAMAGVTEVCVLVAPGDRVVPFENSDHRVGHVVAQGETREEAMGNAEAALAVIQFEMES